MVDTEMELYTVVRNDWGDKRVPGGEVVVYADVEDAIRVAKGLACSHLQETPGMEPSDVEQYEDRDPDEWGHVYAARATTAHWEVVPVEITGTIEEVDG